MPKTPGQLFIEQFFGGIQRGVEGLPRAVRQNRLDERQRSRDSFTQLLNVERVTQVFRDQQLREERNQQALLQTDAIQRANTLLGDAVRTGEIQEAIGPLSEAFGQAGVNPGTSLNIFQRLQPDNRISDDDLDVLGKQAKSGTATASGLRKLKEAGILDRFVPPAKRKGASATDTGLNTNQARILTGEIANQVRAEKKLTDSRVKILREAIADKALSRDKDSPPDQEEQEFLQRLKNLEDYLKFLNTGAAKDSVMNEFLKTIDFIEDQTD